MVSHLTRIKHDSLSFSRVGFQKFRAWSSLGLYMSFGFHFFGGLRMRILTAFTPPPSYSDKRGNFQSLRHHKLLLFSIMFWDQILNILFYCAESSLYETLRIPGWLTSKGNASGLGGGHSCSGIDMQDVTCLYPELKSELANQKLEHWAGLNYFSRRLISRRVQFVLESWVLGVAFEPLIESIPSLLPHSCFLLLALFFKCWSSNTSEFSHCG